MSSFEDANESYNSFDHDDEMPLGMDGESREQVENNANANPASDSAIKESSKKMRKLRSKVWIDFEKKMLPDGSYNAKCNHCKVILSAGGKNGTSHFDILAWWKCNAPKYPVLSSLVRDVLGTPVSTVASESAFSTAGRVLDDYRSSLSSETVEALICSQDWLRAIATDVSSNEVDGAFSSLSESILLDGEVDLHDISYKKV